MVVGDLVMAGVCVYFVRYIYFVVVHILLVMVSDGCSDDVLDALLLVLVMVSFCV